MNTKQSYPNYSDDISTGRSYNLNRWMDAMKNVYIKIHLGETKNDALSSVLDGWDKMEKLEFLNWLKYYESGDHTKYKRAQYYVNDDINYFLPNPKQVPSPIKNFTEQISLSDQEAANAVKHRQEELSKEERRKLIENQRGKILARLHSAEKLLSSHQGQIFAGKDFERLLVAIYELKKQIQTANKVSLSSQTIIDLIVRQANILNNQGFSEPATFLIKFAQNTPGDFSLNLNEIPAGGSVPQGGRLENNTPDILSEDSAIGKFMDNMESSGLTTNDKNSADESSDSVEIGDDVLLDQEIVPEDEENELVVHAQAIPEKPLPLDQQPVPKSAPKTKAENLEGLSAEEVKKSPDVKTRSDFDALIDSVFVNLTVEDVVSKLEDINKIFRNREIGRQLAIADVMLDHLGLAPYFPTLAEATNKQLEANQYCLTRIEDILSKLRGTMETAKIDLTKEDVTNFSPEARKTKQILEQDALKEKQRKDVRKQIQDEVDAEKAKPEGKVENVEQELNKPVQVESPKPIPTAKPV